jgi:NADPH-dependent curcumin reductase CurA
MHDAGDRNHRILFTHRHGKLLAPEDFVADTTAVPTPGPGQFLTRTIYLSLDPADGSPAGDCGETGGAGCVMAGDTVAQVIESRHPAYRPGEYVATRSGWQQFALSSGQGVRRLDAAQAPVSTALGALGTEGLKGYVSLVYLAQPKPGETVLVSGAAGPVGGTAGQVARLISARAVGIEDSLEKCEYTVRELGFAACLDSAGADLAARLRGACPEGIDIYIDSLRGELLPFVAGQLRREARVILCGMGAAYRSNELTLGAVLERLVEARATVRGLVVQDHLERLPELIAVVGGFIRAGTFHYREDITEGLASAPAGFCRLLRGESFGKALVRVAPERL